MSMSNGPTLSMELNWSNIWTIHSRCNSATGQPVFDVSLRKNWKDWVRRVGIVTHRRQRSPMRNREETKQTVLPMRISTLIYRIWNRRKASTIGWKRLWSGVRGLLQSMYYTSYAMHPYIMAIRYYDKLYSPDSEVVHYFERRQLISVIYYDVG